MWDDYSLASLSLFGSYSQPDVSGVNWSLSQLLDFCSYVYQNWMGRVFFPVFINDLLIRELWLYRIVAALSVTIIFYMIYCFSGVPRKPTYAFCSCICYGLLSRRLFTDTFYYWAGYNSYVMPLIFVFGGIFFFIRLRSGDGKSKTNTVGLIICSFIASISQEQLCFTYCLTIGLLCLYDLIKLRSLRLYQWLTLVTSAAGAVFLFLAPGNFSRLGRQGDLCEPTYILRIFKNIKMLCATFYQKDNLPLLFTFIIFLIYLAYLNIYYTRKKPESGKNANRIILFVMFCLWSAVVFLQSLSCKADVTVYNWDPLVTVPWNSASVSVVYVINMSLYTLTAGVLIGLQMRRIKDQYLSAFLVAASLTVVSSFFYSYYIVDRMTITLIFALYLVVLRTLSTIESPNRIIVLNAISICSCLWATLFMCGYWINYPIHKSNEEVFISISARLRENEPTVLEGLSDDWNTYFTPARVFAHGGNRDILEYYDFPDNVQFIPYPPQLYIEE